MKKVSLNFREVAVDGLPEKSMDVFVISRTEDGALYGAGEVAYSAKHKQFNNLDWLDKNENPSFADVAYWVPLSELENQLNGGETP